MSTFVQKYRKITFPFKLNYSLSKIMNSPFIDKIYKLYGKFYVNLVWRSSMFNVENASNMQAFKLKAIFPWNCNYFNSSQRIPELQSCLLHHDFGFCLNGKVKIFLLKILLLLIQGYNAIGKLFQRCTHLLYCSVLSLGGCHSLTWNPSFT